MNIKNSKTNDPKKFAPNLSQSLDLTSLNKHVPFEILTIYYTRKNIRQQYKNNKLKIIAPTWNYKLKLPDGSYSVSNIQDYIKFVIKITKHYLLILLFIFTSIKLIID